MARKRKFLIAGIVFLAAVGALMYVGFQSFFIPTYVVGELKTNAASAYGKTIQLEGRVVETPVELKANWRAQERTLTFTLADDDDDQIRIPVLYRGAEIPDPFWTNPGALVEGKYGEDGVFEATTIFTKCPSRYYGASPTPVS